MNNILKTIHPKLMICLCLIASSFLVYGQILNHDFINFDDNVYVTENNRVKAGLAVESVVWSFTFSDKEKTYWHPLTWLSHMLDYELYGSKPGMHHLSSLILHMANSMLLFLVLEQMTGARWRAFFVAALFALHPLNVESVAWVSERKNVLSTFFWMLALMSYVYYCRRPGLLRYLLTLFVFVLGLLAKPMLVTLPCVLLLLDYWPLGRIRFGQAAMDCTEASNRFIPGDMESPVSRLFLEKVPFFIFSGVSIYLSTFSLQHQGVWVTTGAVPLKLRIANALVSYVSYIGKMIWPRNLAVLYPFPKDMLPIWLVAAAGFFLICASVLAVLKLSRMPCLSIGWLWYVGTLIPVIGLVQGGVWPAMADRWAYVPLIGLFIIIAWGVPDVTARWRHRKVILAVFSSVVLTALMICTWFQVRHWQNSLTLFRHTLNATQNNSIAHYYLGYALDQSGKLDEAMVHYLKSLQIDPRNKLLHNDLGIAWARKGKAQKAVYHFEKALQIDSEYASAHYNLGKVYRNQGNTEAAVSHYRHALRINPDMTPALYNLSWILATHEKATYRNGNEALKLAERLCMLTDYQQPLALDALAAAYAEAGQFKKAVMTAQKAYKTALRYGLDELAFNSNERLKLYQVGRPYR